ncbi:glutathione S-transferase family protein [Biostraticola tofi]|nr:glutathione S-transferase [Biostraticola tofi]
MSYTLYGYRGSGSAAVEMALNAAGLAYTVVETASWATDSDRVALKQVNPLQQIPTLVFPDGAVMTESAAMLIHLGLCHTESGIVPVEPARRAQVLRGLVFLAANCYSAVGIIDYPERWLTADDDALKRLKEGTTGRLHYHWQMFADTFSGWPFLTGDQPGALDFLAVVVSRWSGTRAFLAEKRPQFSQLLQRIAQHPRAASVLARHEMC